MRPLPDPPRINVSITQIAFGLILLLAFGLRLFRLANSDLWGDEAYSVWLSRQEPSAILGALSQGEPHPPFYPLLLWVWMKQGCKIFVRELRLPLRKDIPVKR